MLAGSFHSIEQDNLPVKSAAQIADKKLPNLLSPRKNNISSSWPNNEKEQGTLVSEWLVNLIYKCLATNPEKRFPNGMQIREYINLKTVVGAGKQEITEDADNLQLVNQEIIREQEELQAALARQEVYNKIMYRQWEEVSEKVSSKERELSELNRKLTRPGISVPVLSELIVASMLVGALASYLLLPGRTENQIPDKPRIISTITGAIVHNNKQLSSLQWRISPLRKTVCNTSQNWLHRKSFPCGLHKIITPYRPPWLQLQILLIFKNSYLTPNQRMNTLCNGFQ